MTLASDAPGLNLKRLMADSWRNAAKAWTKDSKSILLFSKSNGGLAIYRRSLNADMPETLIAGAENYRDPISSISGTLLYNAFASEDVDNAVKWRLMSTPIEGGPRSVLMTGRYTYDCASLGSAPCVVADLVNRFSSKWILSHSTWYKFCRSGHMSTAPTSVVELNHKAIEERTMQKTGFRVMAALLVLMTATLTTLMPRNF